MPDDNDWRLQGHVRIHPMGLARDETNDRATLTLVDRIDLPGTRALAFAIPNATAMLLNASKRSFHEAQALLAKDALHHAPRGFVQFDSNADAVDFAEHMTAAVIMAYTALESFANEWIPPWITYRIEKPKEGGPTHYGKEEIERRLHLGKKLHEVLPFVFGVASPKGRAVWQAYVDLEKVRARLIHLKEEDRRVTDSKTDTIWKSLFRTEQTAAPHRTVKQLIDVYMCNAEHSPGLTFDELRPVRPNWHVAYPDELT